MGNGMEYVNPDPGTPDAERGIARYAWTMPCCTSDIEKVQKLFEDVLGFYLVEWR